MWLNGEEVPVEHPRLQRCLAEVWPSPLRLFFTHSLPSTPPPLYPLFLLHDVIRVDRCCILIPGLRCILNHHLTIAGRERVTATLSYVVHHRGQTPTLL